MAIEVENIFDVSARRQGLFVVELERLVRLTGIDSTNPVGYISQIATSSRVPRRPVVIGASVLLYSHESITISDEAKGAARVNVFYKRPEFQADESGYPAFSGETSLVQVATEIAPDGTPISVSYTFPDDDPDPALRGKTITQGGSVTVLEARSTLVIPRIEETNTPGVIAEAWAGYVNTTNWNGKGPRRWLCSRVPFEAVDMTTNPKKYLFRYNFESTRLANGHDPQVSFIDRRTDRPPIDLVADVGYKVLEYAPEKDFNTKFPATN